MPDMLARLHAKFDPMGAVNKKMFGGVCFMLNGNMVAGTSKRGMLVRTGKEFDAVAAKRSDCRPMDMRGAPMAGYWFVNDGIDDKAFEFWIDAALANNRKLPWK